MLFSLSSLHAIAAQFLVGLAIAGGICPCFMPVISAGFLKSWVSGIGRAAAGGQGARLRLLLMWTAGGFLGQGAYSGRCEIEFSGHFGGVIVSVLSDCIIGLLRSFGTVVRMSFDAWSQCTVL
jgi:hypothetical protein